MEARTLLSTMGGAPPEVAEVRAAASTAIETRPRDSTEGLEGTLLNLSVRPDRILAGSDLEFEVTGNQVLIPGLNLNVTATLTFSGGVDFPDLPDRGEGLGPGFELPDLDPGGSVRRSGNVVTIEHRSSRAFGIFEQIKVRPTGAAKGPITCTATFDFDGTTVGPLRVIAAVVGTAAGSYEGDGTTDLALFNAPEAAPGVTGAFDLQPSGGGSSQTVALGLPGDVPVAGDFDGDGNADEAVYRPNIDSNADGTPDAALWIIRQSSDGKVRQVSFGAATDLPVPADYDGDGTTDLATYRPDSDLTDGAAEWFILPGNGATAYRTAFGAAGSDDPVPADYDGDGKADLATFRSESDRFAAASEWFVLPSSGGSAYSAAFGAPGMDDPVPADYDGDGRADLAIFRSESDLTDNTAEWFILPSSGASSYRVALGDVGSIAAPGNYQGTIPVGLAAYDPGTMTWTIRDGGSSTVRTVDFGSSRSVPVLAPLSDRISFALDTAPAPATTTSATSVLTSADHDGDDATLGTRVDLAVD